MGYKDPLLYYVAKRLFNDNKKKEEELIHPFPDAIDRKYKSCPECIMDNFLPYRIKRKSFGCEWIWSKNEKHTQANKHYQCHAQETQGIF